MKKIIIIDGKEVEFKSTTLTALIYKKQFKRDFLRDSHKLGSFKIKNPTKISITDFSHNEIDIMCNLIWALAKTADQTIPGPNKWINTFESFPLLEIIPVLKEMIINAGKNTFIVRR